jgi:ferredoxin
MKRASCLLVAVAILVVLLAFLSQSFSKSNNPCSPCHISYYQYLDIVEGDASNQIPSIINVGETKTVKVIVSNLCNAPINTVMSAVSLSLSSQNGHFSVKSATYTVGSLPIGRATATWDITGVSAGNDTFVITAQGKNTHNSLSFSDNYNPSPSITVGQPPPAPNTSISAPSGGESWNTGSSHNIAWNSSGGTGPLSVQLEYSIAGSTGPWTMISNGLAGNGTFLWTVPNTPSVNCYARATVTDSATPPQNTSTISQTAFTIIATMSLTITVLSPQNSTYTNNSIPIMFTVSNSLPISWTGYSLDGQANITTATNATLVVGEGNHEVIVYATDTSGATGFSRVVYFTYTTKTLTTVTFAQTGVGTDFTGTVLVIDGTNYKSTDLPVSFAWNTSSSHNFAYQSPLLATSNTWKYVWYSTSGTISAQNGNFNVTTSQTITGNYKTLYLLTVSTNPSGLSPQPLAMPTGENASSNGWWYDAQKNVTLTAGAVANYTFTFWHLDDVPQGQGVNPVSATMNASHTAVASYTSSTAASPSSIALSITSPHSGAIWSGGSLQTIIWNSNDSDAAHSMATLLYSTDDFLNSSNIIASEIPNAGNYDWSVPAMDSSFVNLKILVRDPDGSFGENVSGHFGIDSTPPFVVSVEPSNESANVNVSVTLSVVFSEKVSTATLDQAFTIFPNVANVAWTWDNLQKTATATNLSLSPDTTYTCTIVSKVKDVSDPGNTMGTSYSWTFATGPPLPELNQPPVILFEVREPQITANKSVTFDATGTFDGGNAKISFIWDFGDGTPTTETSNPVQTHTFFSDGKYVVSLKASNGKTESTQAMEVWVAKANSVPAASNEGDLVWTGGFASVGWMTLFAFAMMLTQHRVVWRQKQLTKQLGSTAAVHFGVSSTLPTLLLNNERCVGCGLCSRKCPTSAISILDKKPTHDPTKCKMCMECVNKCPRKSIEIAPPCQQARQKIDP